jgi:hypothetical protein
MNERADRSAVIRLVTSAATVSLCANDDETLTPLRV